MGKLTVLLVLTGAAFIWIRIKWANSRNKNVAGKIIDALETGKMSFNSMAETLDMNVRSKSLDQELSPEFFKRLAALNKKTLNEKFTVTHVSIDSSSSSAIIIANAIVKDFIPLSNTNKEVDIFYPCWLLVEANSGNKINFKSQMPHDKDHGYLLEDLSDYVFNHCQLEKKPEYGT